MAVDIDSLFLRGKEAADRGNYDYAIEIFLDILRAAPNHRNSRVALRGCEMEKFRASGGGIKTKAVAFFKGIGPLVKLFLLASKPEKVIENAEKYMVNDPTNLTVMLRLADALAKVGQLEGASDTLEYARQRNPRNVPLLRRLAELNYELGQYEKAVRAYQELIAVRPDDRDATERARHISAESHIKKSGMEGAESFREAMRDEEAARGLEKEGRIQRSQEERDTEVARLLKLTQEKADDSDNWVKLGDAYMRSEQYVEAEGAFRKAFELSKRYLAREKLGTARIKRLEKAEEKAQAELDASGAEPARLAAVREARRMRLDFCVKEFEYRRKQHPTDMKLALQLGQYYFDIGGEENIQKAIQQFQNAVTSPGLRGRSEFMLGRCFAQNPKTLDLAHEQFNKALEALEDKNSEIGKTLMYELGEVAEKRGDAPEAVSWYKKVFGVDAGFRDVQQKIQKLG